LSHEIFLVAHAHEDERRPASIIAAIVRVVSARNRRTIWFTTQGKMQAQWATQGVVGSVRRRQHWKYTDDEEVWPESSAANTPDAADSRHRKE